MLALTKAQAAALPALRRTIPRAIRPAKSNAQHAVESQLSKQAVAWVPEHRFHATRKWRFDYALPAIMVAIEIEGIGGVSRHTTITGYAKDCEKYREAAALGWAVLRFTQGECVARDFPVTLHRLLQTCQTRHGVT